MDAIEAVLSKARLRRQLPAPALRRVLRQSAGLSTADVAHVLGVSAVSVTRYELGPREPRDPHVVAQYVTLLDRLSREGMRA